MPIPFVVVIPPWRANHVPLPLRVLPRTVGKPGGLRRDVADARHRRFGCVRHALVDCRLAGQPSTRCRSRRSSRPLHFRRCVLPSKLHQSPPVRYGCVSWMATASLAVSTRGKLQGQQPSPRRDRIRCRLGRQGVWGLVWSRFFYSRLPVVARCARFAGERFLYRRTSPRSSGDRTFAGLL